MKITTNRLGELCGSIAVDSFNKPGSFFQNHGIHAREFVGAKCFTIDSNPGFVDVEVTIQKNGQLITKSLGAIPLEDFFQYFIVVKFEFHNSDLEKSYFDNQAESGDWKDTPKR